MEHLVFYLPDCLQGFFFIIPLVLSVFSFLIRKRFNKYFHKAIILVLFCAGFNATFIFWMHEEANEGIHMKYAQLLAERRDTIAENQLAGLIDFGKETILDEDDQNFWEKKWLENTYLSSNYNFHFTNEQIDTTVNYYHPFLTFDETLTPIYKIYFPKGYTLSFQLIKDFRRSVYKANDPYKNMKRLGDYLFVVVDQAQVVLANSHDFDLNILNIPLPQIGQGEKVAFNGFDVLAYNHSDDVFVLIGEPLSEVLVWISNFSFFFSLFLLVVPVVDLFRLVISNRKIYELWQNYLFTYAYKLA